MNYWKFLRNNKYKLLKHDGNRKFAEDWYKTLSKNNKNQTNLKILLILIMLCPIINTNKDKQTKVNKITVDLS